MSRPTFFHVLELAAELGLAALIGVLLLALAWAHNIRFDLTPTRQHTLSDHARRTVARLEQDVTLTAFYNSQEQGHVREIKELLQRFADESGHVGIRMYDLDRSPLLADHFNVVNYNAGVLEGYGRRVMIRDLSEGEIDTQLIRLIEGIERVALFAIGHGERDPSSADPRSGLSQAARALEAENYRIERSSDLRGGIPTEVALVVAAGPTRDFPESELAALTAHLERGGGALVLLEAGTPPRFAAWLGQFGIQPGNDLIVDERNRLFFADSFAPQVALFNDEVMPYTGSPPAVLPLAQSVVVVEPTLEDARVAPFAFTGSDTWSDVERVSIEGKAPVFRPGIDHRGPLAIAAISHLDKGADSAVGGSTVAVGDADFATNLYFGSLGNRDFFLNLAQLAARAESVIGSRGEARPGGTFSQVYLTAWQARILFWCAVVVLPGSMLVVGGLVGWRRRRRSAG